MQKVLVVINSYPEGGATTKLYQQYARPDQEITVRRLDSLYVAWDGHELEVSDPRNEIKLDEFDAVHFAGWQTERDMAYVVANYLAQKGIPFTGKTILDLDPGSKVGEMTKLVTSGVPYPKTFYVCDSKQLSRLFDWAEPHYGLHFPVVVKSIWGSKGEHNYLARSREDLQVLRLDPGHRYVIQEAIPNQCDYRVLVMGGEVILVIRRTRTDQDSHLNNTSQGAQAEVVEKNDWPAGLRETSIAAARALGRDDISGVDILIDEETNDLYVLEVNKTPHMAIGAPNIIESKLRALYDYLHTL